MKKKPLPKWIEEELKAAQEEFDKLPEWLKTQDTEPKEADDELR